MGLADLFKKQEKKVEEVKQEVKEEVKAAATEVKEAIKPVASFKGGKEVTEHVKPIASFKGGEEVKSEADKIKAQAQAAVAQTKEKVETATKNLEDVANRVIRGEFGNGEERKAALEKAGFKYDEVQAKVNEIMTGVKDKADTALKSVEEVAKEVIRGDWGNGEERKAALEKAGYKFEEIQAKVNELLK